MRYLNASDNDRPRVRTIQNPYSLLNRTFEVGNSEICHREDFGLLAYSPLAFGVLSGKYRGGKKPENARLTLFPNYDRYSTDSCKKAVDAYYALAIKNGLSLTQLSLAFVNDRPFVTSNIIGATTMDQLKENIDSIDISLSKELLKQIEDIHLYDPNPCV